MRTGDALVARAVRRSGEQRVATVGEQVVDLPEGL
jgi:hypothetical protein